jgi:quinol monooxygenase YgiN
MLGVVATIKIKEGKGAVFEKVATELVNKVNENEKGCLLYQLYYGEVPNTYAFMERYTDEAAVEAHRGTEYFKTSAGRWANSWTASRSYSVSSRSGRKASKYAGAGCRVF